MPKNHNIVLRKCFKIYKKTKKVNDITKVYKMYEEEIKKHDKKQNKSDTDETSKQTDDEDEKENNNDENGNENEPVDNSGKDKGPGETPTKPKNRGNNRDDDDEDSDEKNDGGKTEKFIQEKREITFVEDNEETYSKKRKFLRHLTFKQYEEKKYRGIFKKYFRFTIRTETLFKFIKYVYSHKKMPKNHNIVLRKCFKIYKKTKKFNDIMKVYKMYEEEIKKHDKKQNGSDTDETSKQTEDEDEKENNKGENGNENEPVDNSGTDKGPGETPKKPKNQGNHPDDDDSVSDDENDSGMTENFTQEKREVTYVEDNEETYNQKRQFLKYLTFKQCRNKKYMSIFVKYFRFKIRTRTLFNFLKYCYSHKKMPKNHNKALKKCLKNYGKLKNVNLIHDIYKIYNRDLKMYHEEQDESENHNRFESSSETYGENGDVEQESLKPQFEGEYDDEYAHGSGEDDYGFSDVVQISDDEEYYDSNGNIDNGNDDLQYGIEPNMESTSNENVDDTSRSDMQFSDGNDSGTQFSESNYEMSENTNDSFENEQNMDYYQSYGDSYDIYGTSNNQFDDNSQSQSMYYMQNNPDQLNFENNESYFYNENAYENNESNMQSNDAENMDYPMSESSEFSYFDTSGSTNDNFENQQAMNIYSSYDESNEFYSGSNDQFGDNSQWQYTYYMQESPENVNSDGSESYMNYENMNQYNDAGNSGSLMSESSETSNSDISKSADISFGNLQNIDYYQLNNQNNEMYSTGNNQFGQFW